MLLNSALVCHSLLELLRLEPAVVVACKLLHGLEEARCAAVDCLHLGVHIRDLALQLAILVLSLPFQLLLGLIRGHIVLILGARQRHILQFELAQLRFELGELLAVFAQNLATLIDELI